MEIQNPTNFKIDLLAVGTICNLIDIIDYSDGTMCTVRLVEQDNEFEDLFYYYLVANDEKKNIQFDPRIGNYFDIVSNDSDRLVPIAQATMY